MNSLLFVIPNYSSDLTGSSKRSKNLSKHLSFKWDVKILSKDNIISLSKGRVISQKKTTFFRVFSIFFYQSFDYWFCDHIKWSLMPTSGLIFTIHDMKEWTKHGRSGFLKKLILYIVARKAKLLITVSDDQKIMIKKFLNIESYVFQNAVSRDWLNFNSIRKKNINIKKTKYIVYVSNFTNHKSHLDLINNPQLKSFKMIFVGTPIDKRGLSILKTLSKNKKIKIYNNISERRLIKIVDESVFAVFPSIYEGFGMPILETIAINKKILISNKLKLQHYKNCPLVRKVDFKNGITKSDIKWASTPFNRKINISKTLVSWETICKRINHLLIDYV